MLKRSFDVLDHQMRSIRGGYTETKVTNVFKGDKYEQRDVCSKCSTQIGLQIRSRSDFEVVSFPNRLTTNLIESIVASKLLRNSNHTGLSIQFNKKPQKRRTNNRVHLNGEGT